MKTTITFFPRILTMLTALMVSAALHAEITIEQCVEKAMANYPAISQYRLASSCREIELSDINKGWLPRIGLYAQATAQNIVPTFPSALSDVLTQMGQPMEGMGKVQYKLGVDISQTIWDGGASKARRDIVRSQEAMQTARLDVEMYPVRERVENLYFAVLLTEQQIATSRITYEVLCNNLEKLKVMLRNGVAMRSDVDMVEAQALSLMQNITQAQSAAASYRKALGLFVGENLESETLAMPSGEIPSSLESSRPELTLFDSRLRLNHARQRLADTSLMPRIGFFTQGWYGYPGFNNFRSMMNRDLSFNFLAGLKASWNIDSFYTKRNTSAKTSLEAESVAVDRDVFLFNSKIQTASLTETIRGLIEVMKDDSRITLLLANVRKAAESQLTNGVIDATALLTKIADENRARLTSKFHEIELLQEIYKLKYTLDR